MMQKSGLLTHLLPIARLGLGLALAGLSMGAMAQTPQPKLADATACVPKQYVEKTAQGETTYYVVCIKQLDGTRKEVRYTKSVSGAIMPPPVNDGKLLDGSVASGNDGEDRRANRKIIGKYDKDKQVFLAMADGLWEEANQTLSRVMTKMDTNTVTKNDIYELYKAISILSFSTDNVSSKRKVTEMFTAADTYAQKKLGLGSTETSQIQEKAKAEAQQRWREATRSLD